MREFMVFTEEGFGDIHLTTVFGEQIVIEERGEEGYNGVFSYVDFRVDGTLIRAYSVISITEKVEDAEVDIEILE